MLSVSIQKRKYLHKSCFKFSIFDSYRSKHLNWPFFLLCFVRAIVLKIALVPFVQTCAAEKIFSSRLRCFIHLLRKSLQGLPRQVQATHMYGAAQPDFFKSETTWDIKIITTHHLYIYKSCVFTQNLEGVTPKISLPRPWEVWNGQGRGSVIFQDTLFKFCGKLSFYKILNW